MKTKACIVTLILFFECYVSSAQSWNWVTGAGGSSYDIANDIYNESDSYRGEVTLAAAMKSPDGTVMWQQAFRGQGYVQVDPQFSTGLGPQDAVVDAIRDALSQMQDAIVSSPQVRLQMQHYQSIAKARSEATQDASAGK